MNEDAGRRRRAGGRAGNKSRAGTAAIDQMPWRIPVNPDRPTEPLDMDGVMAIHRGAMRILSEIGIEFLNPEAVDDPEAGGLQGRGHERADGRGLRDGDAQDRARAVHDHAAQPGARDHAGRQAHGLRQRLVPAERLGPGAGQALGRFRDLQGIHEADAVFQLHPCRGRLPGRADRHPPLGPPPRLPVREADADRQGRARLFAGGGAGRGRDGDDAHRGRADGGGVPRQAAHVYQHQLGQPAEARLSDAGRRDAAGAAGAAGGGDALHAGGRDGAGHDVGRRGAVAGRGAVGDRAVAIHRAGLPGDDRHLHLATWT